MIKVLMSPHENLIPKRSENGIARVVQAYFKYLPEYGIELVGPSEPHHLAAAHVGEAPGSEVAHVHGLYWTADYEAAGWEWRVNETVISAIRKALAVTVPSNWVAEAFQRDMHFAPEVVPHGIDLEDWGDPEQHEGFALWNKNRIGDVCNPAPVLHLARQFSNIPFVMTFAGGNSPDNVEETGLLAHEDMKKVIKAAGLYLSTTKETFGIGTLEAMASGVPVLGYADGGNLEIVVHGETGYLAEPGNTQDLVDGFQFVMSNRTRLGENARERAKQFTWDGPVEQIANIYRAAYEKKTATSSVSIVIPTFNYADKVGRAIESAINQDYEHLEEIIVVDDGSQDAAKTLGVVAEYNDDPRVSYIYQDNQGVAQARNAGIAKAKTKYVACLDADDAIEPAFLSTCIAELEKDPSMGIAFTRLAWIKGDGSEGVSDWPGHPDYNRQIERQNQIPTCCVFQKEMWSRLGGYRSRYAPGGAGSEDAEFWLRAGSIGYGSVLAGSEPLFIYSWETGRVSGDPDYKEPDWLFWHPWTQDGQHPFASIAKPRGGSHPVRQYDQPAVTVVIPVGPDHLSLLTNALDSLEAQTFRKWEVICVLDTGSEPAQFEFFRKAYPYVQWLHLYEDFDEPRGAGFARNRGAEAARSPFLFFLDADDWLYPQALEEVLAAYAYQEGVIYFDYVGKANVDDVEKLAPDLQERIYHHEDGVAILGHKSLSYDPEKAQAQPEGKFPYIWTNVTTLIPKVWHDEINGFDEEMESWEDVDYHWRMARAGKCYVRIPEELMVYRFSTGGRRDAGLQEYQSLIEYLRRKYEGEKIVGCNCGGGAVYRKVNGTGVMMMAQAKKLGVSMTDDDYVRVKYMSANRGAHKVIGPKSRKDYGRRGGGQIFLVLTEDALHSPHLFQKIQEVPAMAQPAAPAAPPSPIPPPPVAQPAEAVASGTEVEFNLSRLPGVSTKVAGAMEDAGIQSAQDILDLGEIGLQAIPGIGAVTAERIFGAVVALSEVAALEE